MYLPFLWLPYLPVIAQSFPMLTLPKDPVSASSGARRLPAIAKRPTPTGHGCTATRDPASPRASAGTGGARPDISRPDCA